MTPEAQGDSEAEVLSLRAVQLHQLGYYAEADSLYKQVLEKSPTTKQMLRLYGALQRQMIPGASLAPWRVVWQAQPAYLWEAEWLSYLLGDTPQGESIVDTGRKVCHENMIVIDNRLSANAEGYYADAYAKGCNVILIHLSDESYIDDCSCYEWCNAVFRNYWSVKHLDNRRVEFFPLGYKTGFSKTTIPKKADERQYLWSFMGNAKHPSRKLMLDAIQGIGSNFTHFTSTFNSSDTLPTEKYREIMEQTIFVPCPSGGSNLESFRVWEALEAGCIPIVERRGNFDYFRSACATHPFPTVSDWKDVASVLKGSLLTWENLRMQCMTWWQTYKTTLKARITAATHSGWSI
jgi:hypothetical protein